MGLIGPATPALGPAPPPAAARGGGEGRNEGKLYCSMDFHLLSPQPSPALSCPQLFATRPSNPRLGCCRWRLVDRPFFFLLV